MWKKRFVAHRTVTISIDEFQLSNEHNGFINFYSCNYKCYMRNNKAYKYQNNSARMWMAKVEETIENVVPIVIDSLVVLPFAIGHLSFADESVFGPCVIHFKCSKTKFKILYFICILKMVLLLPLILYIVFNIFEYFLVATSLDTQKSHRSGFYERLIHSERLGYRNHTHKNKCQIKTAEKKQQQQRLNSATNELIVQNQTEPRKSVYTIYSRQIACTHTISCEWKKANTIKYNTHI